MTMSKDRLIGFVSPPFAGHLFPLLAMARGLKSRGYQNLMFYSTPEAGQAITASGLELSPVLRGVSHVVLEISDTKQRVGSNPLRLLRQLRMNLSLMDRLQEELRTLWKKDQPAVIIADLTTPVAGLLAQQMGIHWWSSLPTLCVLESDTGTPSYLGGWMPSTSMWGRLRDWCGRKAIRTFKQSMRLLFRRRLRSLGIDRIYRRDGSEVVYSNEKVLGLGVAELEFPREWPKTLEFIGPLTASPVFPHQTPTFESGRTHVLISLGTHLWWAKDSAMKLIESVADRMPDIMFHYTIGKVDDEQWGQRSRPNVQCHRYLPYQLYLHQYDAVIHHGGAGVMYACLQQGIPALIWPQDYDQFDHASRLVYHGLGLRLRPRPDMVVADLRQLLSDTSMSRELERFQQIIEQHHPVERVCELLESLDSNTP